MQEIQPFTSKWFTKYQKPLLWYINTIGRDRIDLPTNKKIIRIYPHALTWREDKKYLSTAFYPRSPIADSIVMDLYPFWKLLHNLDMSFLARKLSLNFGFDTLIRYPDPHPEVTTVDGIVRRVTAAAGETFATIRAGAGTNEYSTAGYSYPAQLGAHAATVGNYLSLGRSVTLFDTSTLTAAATIVFATYSITTSDVIIIGLGDTHLCLVTSDPASNTALAISDFERTWGTTNLYEVPAYISQFNNGMAGGNRSVKPMSSAGRALISKTGITKLGNILGWDLTGDTTGLVWAASATTNMSIYYSDYDTNPTHMPQLVVTYYFPTSNMVLDHGSPFQNTVAESQNINLLEQDLLDHGQPFAVNSSKWKPRVS